MPGGENLALEVVAGNAAGFRITVEERLVIGRQSPPPGRLADDPELSRHHAEISRRPTGDYAVEDLSSTNGTYVNGVRITAPALLQRQDTIELGTTTLIVLSAPVAEELAEVDVRAATVTDVSTIPRGARPPEPEPKPQLGLRLEVDLEEAYVQILLDGAPEPIWLELVDGRWQVALTPRDG
ncbi:MAG TPA: FHA domain-containing protein [Solirubrobacteraceae bacterium]|nr:FHA domain-containing protein [Solirubrobacteraceae bacterium]